MSLVYWDYGNEPYRRSNNQGVTILDAHMPKFPELNVQQWQTLLTESLDSQLVGAPSNIAYCNRCVQSNQRPRIVFDSEGICSACRYWQRKDSIDWASREEQLSQILDAHRSKDGSYDVIVPGSGG